MRPSLTLLWVIASLSVGSRPLLGAEPPGTNQPPEPAFSIKIVSTEVAGAGQFHRPVATLGTNKFYFQAPRGFRVRTDDPRRIVFLEDLSGQCSITVRHIPPVLNPAASVAGDPPALVPTRNLAVPATNSPNPEPSPPVPPTSPTVPVRSPTVPDPSPTVPDHRPPAPDPSPTVPDPSPAVPSQGSPVPISGPAEPARDPADPLPDPDDADCAPAPPGPALTASAPTKVTSAAAPPGKHDPVRELILQQYPSAQITEEYEMTAGGLSGVAFDFHWKTISGLRLHTRVCYVESSVGTFEFTMVVNPELLQEFHAAFNSVLVTFRLVPGGKLELPEIPSQS